MPANTLKLVGKSIYRGHTIFRYKENGKTIYKVQNGISRSKFTTIASAKKAIDRFRKKHFGE